MIRFLLDANLPPALADWLRAKGHEAVHVHSIGLTVRLYIAIGRYASKTYAIVVTKDKDFALLNPSAPDGPVVL